MKVKVVDRSGQQLSMDAKVARALVRMGRFSYLTRDLQAEPKVEAAKPEPKKRGRKKKVEE